jgi:hypothetical protein
MMGKGRLEAFSDGCVHIIFVDYRHDIVAVLRRIDSGKMKAPKPCVPEPLRQSVGQACVDGPIY